MTKKLSNREKIMMGFLGLIVIVALYYMLVLTPTKDRITKIGIEQKTAEDQITTLQTQVAKMDKMQKELDGLFNSGKTVSMLATYDNSTQVMNELNSVLAAATTYRLSFSDIDASSNVVRRNIRMQFEASSYDLAYQLLQRFENSSLRCMISDLTVNFSDKTYNEATAQTYSSRAVSVTASITYYEYQENAPAEATQTPTDTAQ